MGKIKRIKTSSHEEWLDLRRNSIGGSDAAVLTGSNKYRSPYSLWLDKTGKQGNAEPNEAMRQGTDFEGYVAKRFTEKTGKKVRKNSSTLVNSDYPFAHANIDRQVVGERAGLECKTINPIRWGGFKDGDYPTEYWIQCQHYLAVTELDKWYLAILVLGKEFHVYEIERDEEFISGLMDLERKFMDENVSKGVPPNVDGSKSTEEAIRLYYSNPEPNSEIDLKHMDSAMDALQYYKEQKAEAEDNIKLIQQRLEEELGNNEQGLTSKYKVTWKPQTRKNFQYNVFIKDHPEFDYAPYYREKTSRVFKVQKR